jgi:hypothetical protein
MMGGGGGYIYWVWSFGGVRGLLGACGGVSSGVGWGCSVCVSCNCDGLLLVGCWGLQGLGGLL